jgi:homoserine trans-succinylase
MMKYFYGSRELCDARSMPNMTFKASYPDVKGKNYDSFHKWVGAPIEEKELREKFKTWLPVTRIIQYSDKPSLHLCDGRCMSATGKNCQCSCGGKNHGLNS